MDEIKCPACKGRGETRCDCWPGDCICGQGDQECEHCHGEGWVWAEDYEEDLPSSAAAPKPEEPR